ncbi:MAG: RIP metalloprotease RseP [Steroidobacteraceae bacterium]
MNMLILIASFLLAIGVLVAVHEFGHYWVAKRLGFKVLRYSIGFGKPLLMRVGRDADRTEYCVSAIPLGGYVKLLDEREGEVDPAELHRSFTRRPVAQRIAVLLAGPAMNLLFAALLYAVLAMIGTQTMKPLVGQVRLDSPAALAGLQRGDEITSVGDTVVADTEELQIALFKQVVTDRAIRLQVRRGGEDRTLRLRVFDDAHALTEPGRLLPGLGFDLASWSAPVLVQEVPAGSAGARAGLRAGDRLIAVDGQSVANATEFRNLIAAAGGSRVLLDLQRQGEHLQINAEVPQVVDHGEHIGRLGISMTEGTRTLLPGLLQQHRAGPLEALGQGFVKTWDMSLFTVQMLGRIVTGQVSAKNISGPLSIAEFAGVSAQLGFTAFLGFLAVISVSLGVLNLLPVPLLDGGQVVYQMVEAVKGKPLSDRAQLLGQQLGIALLVVLMSLAFYNDISRHLN